MNNQHLLLDKLTNIQNKTLAVKYTIGPNTFVGISRMVTLDNIGSDVRIILIDFEWTLRVYIRPDLLYIPFRSSLIEYPRENFLDPHLLSSGGSLSLYCKDDISVLISINASDVFGVRQLKALYDKRHRL